MRKFFLAAILFFGMMQEASKTQILLPILGANDSPTPCASVSCIPNMDAWLEADCITYVASVCGTLSNGADVVTWADRSGANHPATVLTATGTCVLNTNQINTLPAVTMSVCHMSFAVDVGLSGTDGATSFVVFALTSNAAKSTLLSEVKCCGNNAGPAYWFSQTPSPKLQGFDNDGIAAMGNGTAAADTSWHQTNVRVTGSGGTQPVFRLAQADDATIGGTVSPSWTYEYNRIGYNGQNGGEPFAGKVAVIILFRRKLTTSERDIVETYLNGKYGV